MTLGEIIKEYRASQGLSQDAIADRSGLSKAYISILERNKNPKTGVAPIPSLKTINAIAIAINSDFDTIFSRLDPDFQVTIGDQLPQTQQTASLPSNIIPFPTMSKVPLVGQIACGTPILAEENITDYVDVPGHIKADYALTCKGDSMVNAGIRDGDIVYIRQQDEVENGQIAAVMVDGDEATLKRFYFDGSQVQLVAENPKIMPRAFSGEEINRVHVIGLAVAYVHVLE